MGLIILLGIAFWRSGSVAKWEVATYITNYYSNTYFSAYLNGATVAEW